MSDICNKIQQEQQQQQQQQLCAYAQSIASAFYYILCCCFYYFVRSTSTKTLSRLQNTAQHYVCESGLDLIVWWQQEHSWCTIKTGEDKVQISSFLMVKTRWVWRCQSKHLNCNTWRTFTTVHRSNVDRNPLSWQV